MILMSRRKLDILAVGAHPDDVEIGMGGTIAKYCQEGYTAGIVNLTKAELSSNGTIEERQKEAEKAAEILKVSSRRQLSFPDRRLNVYKEEAIEALVDIIREYRPRLVFAPHWKDRHPDHGHCGDIVREAVFSAGIKKYLEECPFPAYRPSALYYYQINGSEVPDFVVDISDFLPAKLEALASYKSQFQGGDSKTSTPLNNGYIDRLKSRERVLGFEAGVEYAEGFISEKPVLIHHLLGDHN